MDLTIPRVLMWQFVVGAVLAAALWIALGSVAGYSALLGILVSVVPNAFRTEFRPRQQDIASEIIEITRTNSYDVVVLNRKHARVTRFFSGSVSHKVLMTLKDTTVCVVS